MADESYEGWANRETWCLNLWLANDEGLYNMVTDWTRDLLDDSEDDHEPYTTAAHAARYRLATRLQDWYDDYRCEVCEYGSEARNMVDDIGSHWRIDYEEIAGHWVADEVTERASS